MSFDYYTLEPHSSLVLRDNRFFGAGSVMACADWISPSVMAGSVRTVVGKARGGPYNHDALRRIAVAGPLPVADGALGFVPPADALAMECDGKRKLFCLAPKQYADGQGTDLPEGLRPCLLMPPGAKGKPVSMRGFWRLQRMVKWLVDPKPSSDSPVDLPAPESETRTHVGIDDIGRGAEKGKLYSCAYLGIPGKHSREYSLSVRVEQSAALPRALIHPVGGERRLVSWEKKDTPAEGWTCPAELTTRLATARQIRMVLATPAIFAHAGWKPDWIDGSLEGTAPGTSVKLRLVAACVPRWKAVSGWSYEHKGPKAVRRMVPAGAVYFFDVLDGNAGELAQRWLQPAGDEGTDGFGLALWGIGNWK